MEAHFKIDLAEFVQVHVRKADSLNSKDSFDDFFLQKLPLA